MENIFVKDIEDLVIFFNAKKAHVKEFLKKHFKQDIDYKEENLPTIKERRYGGGGHNKIVVTMTIETFEMIKNTYRLRHNKNFSIIKTDNTVINYVNRIMNLEESTIGFIYECYKDNTNLKRQYNIDNYNIDLYFIDYKIALECDEYGHSDRDEKYEKEREQCIKNVLNCVFIRFNPNHKDFKISVVMSLLIKCIEESKIKKH